MAQTPEGGPVRPAPVQVRPVLVYKAPAERARGILNRLRNGDDLEPDEDPDDGSADFATGERGRCDPLVVVAEHDTARAMYDYAATLGSVRVEVVLPNLCADRKARRRRAGSSSCGCWRRTWGARSESSARRRARRKKGASPAARRADRGTSATAWTACS